MKKRIPAVMTAVLLAVSTAACGGSGTAETGSTGQAPSETAAYYTDQIITPSEFASYDEFSLGEMRIVDQLSVQLPAGRIGFPAAGAGYRR